MPLRARLPWFLLWVPLALLTYAVVNGGGYLLVLHRTGFLPEGLPPWTAAVPVCLRFLCGAAALVAWPALAVLAYASWRTVPEWSRGVRWTCGMLGLLLAFLLVLAQGALLASYGAFAVKLGPRPSLIPVPGGVRSISPALRRTWRPHPGLLLGERPVGIVLRDDPDADVRLGVIRALCAHGEPGDIPDLARVCRSGDAAERLAAVQALGILGDAGVVPVLLPRLEDRDAEVRAAAASTLGLLEARSPIPALVPLLSDPQAGVRASAAYALGALGAKDSLPAVARLLEDPSAEVREAAAQAVGQLVGESWPLGEAGVARARAWVEGARQMRQAWRESLTSWIALNLLPALLGLNPYHNIIFVR